ncbi:lipopolysaccharide biosynthesis protein [Ruminococcus flavefaciens]|uniref:Membrane protein involved in the export of O-antigen and teichoic acid n=1 Tax=Ruminococcus flavefaciens TaxID=1265 RepID=A0A1M7GA54_RUMFL|nr:oligosaccharide flippase family protein [Ruminococcus flavefaciens]SHM13121.1 Membrane protein involved in the export of O-antigen and teichoic acid [Ruminococcus flavefaciens]
MKKIIEKYKSMPIQLRASIWFLMCSFLQKGISTITTPIFTRILSPDEYGSFGTFNSWYSIIYIIVSMNLASGVYTTAMVKFSDDRNILASSYQGLTLFLCSAWTIIYLIAIDFWNNLFSLTTVQMLSLLLMVWTSSAFSLWCVEQRVSYSYKKLVLVTVIVSFAKPILGIILVCNSDDKVTARIIGLAIVELFGYSVLSIYQMARGKKLISKKYWAYAFKFNLPLIPHALSQTVLSSADRIMIKNMVGERQAGFYNLAYSISLIMIIFNTALSQTLAPWTYQKLKSNKAEDINGIAVFSMGMIALLNLLLISFAPEVIRIFAPSEYAEAVYAIPPVAMSVFFMYLYDWFARFEYFYEKTYYLLIASILGAALNLLLNYLLIPICGYIAAGYTTLICYMVYSFMHFYFMRRISQEQLPGRKIYNIKHILLITSIFMLSSFGLLLTYKHMIVRYCCLVFILAEVFINRKIIITKSKELVNIRNKK